MFFLVLFFFLTFLVIFYNYFWKRKSLPPGPPPLPLIGNLLELNADPPGYTVFKKWQKKYGNIYTYWIAEKPIVMINDYKTMYETFVKDGETFNGRSDIGHHMDYIRGGNYGIVFIEGETWKEHRKFAMQVFRNFGMGRNLMEEKIKNEIQFFITDIIDAMNQASEIELNPIPLIDRTIANAINQMLFGFAFHSKKENEEYETLKNTLSNFLGFGAWPSILFGLSFPKIVPKLPYFKQQMSKFRESYWELRNFFQKIIDEHKKDFKARKDKDFEPKDYVEAYLQEAATKTSLNHNFTDDFLVNIIVDLWGAGQETTANTCIFSLLYILNNPKIQDKIDQELDSVIGSDRMICLADKNALIYINAFINEVQRSVNLLPQNLFHKTTKDTKIGKYFIQKGTTIIPQISMVLYDENIFPEPDKFKPERFIDSEGNLKKFDELIPFSLGKRQCLGEALARMQLFLFVTNFYNHFKISAIDPQRPPSLKKIPGIAIQPIPFTCNIKKRFD